MSVAATKWAKRQRVRHACGSVLAVLADRANKHGQCWPSQSTIAIEARLAVRTVRLILAELEVSGVIVRRHRGNGVGGRTTDMITLTIGRDFDLLDARPKARKKRKLPAEDAGKGGGSYRQIKDGLAAYEGQVSGRICRGRNLSLTEMNLIPSRDARFQDKAQGEQTPARGSRPVDPYGDDAFGPLPSTLGLDSDAWDETSDVEEFAR